MDRPSASADSALSNMYVMCSLKAAALRPILHPGFRLSASVASAQLPRMAPIRGASERLQFLSACFGEIPQRVDMPVDPVRPHLGHCHVRREISVDNDPGHGVRG